LCSPAPQLLFFHVLKINAKGMRNLVQSYRDFEKVNAILEKHQAILAKHQNNPDSLISVLQQIQEEYRYLPEEILAYVATAMRVSPSRVYGVATFYENFSLHPKGKYVIKVCDGTACHVKKSQTLIDTVRTQLNLKEGVETTDDLLFTLEVVSCLGACGLAAVLLINDKVYSKVTSEEMKQILDEYRRKEDLAG
jgi:NADH-quinone oxidoreductase subunit E